MRFLVEARETSVRRNSSHILYIDSGQVRQCLVSYSQLILGANSLVQAALPALLRDTPQSFFDGIMNHIQAS